MIERPVSAENHHGSRKWVTTFAAGHSTKTKTETSQTSLNLTERINKFHQKNLFSSDVLVNRSSRCDRTIGRWSYVMWGSKD